MMKERDDQMINKDVLNKIFNEELQASLDQEKLKAFCMTAGINRSP